MAISQYYVDYGAGSDATGTGAIGTPWKTIQKALDTITRNATDGDQINIKAGAADVLAASLTLATYGGTSPEAPLILRGYTAAANDYGRGVIDCGWNRMWAATNYTNIHLVDLELHTFGNNNGIEFTASPANISILRCKVHKGASAPNGKSMIVVGQYSRVLRCHVFDSGVNGTGISVSSSGCLISANYCVAAPITTGNAQGSSITGNIMVNSSISIIGGGPQYVTGNIVWRNDAGTTGIVIGNSPGRYTGVVVNNIVVGVSGVGGSAISATVGAYTYIVGYNAFYNNTANYSITSPVFMDERANDVTLAADPFTDAANGDFSLTAAAKTALADKGWPLAYLGAHANTVPHLNIGPIQLAATAPVAGKRGRLIIPRR